MTTHRSITPLPVIDSLEAAATGRLYAVTAPSGATSEVFVSDEHRHSTTTVRALEPDAVFALVSGLDPGAASMAGWRVEQVVDPRAACHRLHECGPRGWPVHGGGHTRTGRLVPVYECSEDERSVESDNARAGHSPLDPRWWEPTSVEKVRAMLASVAI